MMEEPGKEPLERREYTVGRWFAAVMLAAGLVQIALAVSAFSAARMSTISIRNADGTYTEITEEPSSFERYQGVLCLALGVCVLFYAATYWDYRVVVDETGVQVRSLLLNRRVTWDEVQWSNVWSKNRVILGLRRGRALPITTGLLRPHEPLVDGILSHLRQPRFLRIRRGLSLPVILGGLFTMGTAFSVTHLPWLVGAGAGAVAGLVLGAVVRRDDRSRPVLAWVICAAVAVIAGGVSGAFDLAAWPRVWMAVGITGGWLCGFVPARMHEEMMRGTPGTDLAREVKPLSVPSSE